MDGEASQDHLAPVAPLGKVAKAVVKQALFHARHVVRTDTYTSTACAVVIVRGEEGGQFLQTFGLRDAVRFRKEEEPAFGPASADVIQVQLVGCRMIDDLIPRSKKL